MAEYKRWFPVSHDINSDPEMIGLTDQFGLAGLKVWLEILSVSDRSVGRVSGDYEATVRALTVKCNTTKRQVRGILQYCHSKLWIDLGPPIKVLNYLKYHRTREPNSQKKENELDALLPSFLPSLPNDPKKEEEICAELLPAKPKKTPSSPSRKSASGVDSWPLEDAWMLGFLQTQTKLPQLRDTPAEDTKILCHDWWEHVDSLVGGFDLPWIEAEFTKIAVYLQEKPRKTPTARGWRSFLRNWLQNAREYERRRNHHA